MANIPAVYVDLGDGLLQLSIVPHIFVWGSCFRFCIPLLRRLVLLLRRLLSLSHTTCSHTTLSHTTLPPLYFTHSLLTYNFVTHYFVTHTHTHLSHTTLSHTIVTHTHTHAPLSHKTCSHTTTQLFHSHTTCSHTTLSHTIFHTQLCHTQLCHTQLCHTPSFTHNFVTYNCHTQLCHRQLAHTQLDRTWRHPPSLCVAGVALGDIDTSLRGRRVTWRHPPSLCVAGVALRDIHLRFAWQGWHFWHWAGSSGALGPVTPRHFAWQTWHLATSTVTLRPRRSTFVCLGRGCGMTRLCVPQAQFPAEHDSKGCGLMRLAGHTPKQWPASSRPCDCRTSRPALHRVAWEADISHTSMAHATLAYTTAAFLHTTCSHSYTTISKLPHFPVPFQL